MNLKTSAITAIAAAICLTLSAAAMAKSMSKVEYKAAMKNIEAEYNSAKASCAPLAAHAKGICMVQAGGRQTFALAQLAAAYQPSRKSRNDVRTAQAQAEYSMAAERCGDKAGNEKNVCLKKTEAAQAAAKADARAQWKSSAAYKIAVEKFANARAQAHQQVADSRKGSAIDR
jgi:hypothetical protein